MHLFARSLAALLITATPSFALSVDLTSMTLNGDASIDGSGDLELTQAVGGQSGSAFTAAQDIDANTSFSAFFEFIIDGSSNPADGLTFVVQNSTSGDTALGQAGGGLGLLGITPSIAVEFDTYLFNSGDPAFQHVGIDVNGSIDSVAVADPGFLLSGGVSRFAWIEYDSGTLDVFVNTDATKPGAALLSTTFDLTTLGDRAYFGFTAATGGLISRHVISQFDLEVESLPGIPVLPAMPLLATGLGALAVMRRRKS